jgi:hypothetical protein
MANPVRVGAPTSQHNQIANTDLETRFMLEL